MNRLIYPKFRWFTLATMLIVTTITSMAMISPAPLVPDIRQNMSSLSLGEVSFLTMGYFNLFNAIAALFGGRFLDKFGVIKCYIGGMILIALGALLVPFIGSTYWGMVLIRFFQGVGTGPIMAAAAPVAAAYFPKNERSIVTGVQGFSVSLGVMLGFIIVPRIFQASGSWETALACLAPISLLGIIMSIIVMFGPKSAGEEKVENPGNEIKTALIMPVTWVAISIIVLMCWIFNAFNDLIPGYLSTPAPVGLGKGAVSAGQSMVGAQILFMVGSIFGGFLTEKLFKGKARPIIVMGFLFGAICVYALKLNYITGHHMLLVFSLSSAAFFFAFVNPQAMGYIAKNYPRHITGKLGGMAMGIGIFGGLAGVSVGAFALHITGFYQKSINIMIIILLIGLVVSLFLKAR